jgi:hypothetical protein
MRSDGIMNAAASLLGVALLIVTALHVTDRASQSISDEIAFGSAFLLIGSCLCAHFAIGRASKRLDVLAANLFFVALVALLLAVLGFWF